VDIEASMFRGVGQDGGVVQVMRASETSCVGQDWLDVLFCSQYATLLWLVIPLSPLSFPFNTRFARVSGPC